MIANREIKNAISAADMDAQYDEKAKRLLSNKSILAHILAKTVDAFQGMNPEDVVPYIEGEPFISAAPVEPGLTNVVRKQPVDDRESGQRIVGMNTENAEINEGLVRFDIIFYVRIPSSGDKLPSAGEDLPSAGDKLPSMDVTGDGLSQIIINLEAQKDEPRDYHILNRAVFYVSRLISSQKERDFVGSNYNDVKRVFSIWVCMNMEENSMAHMHLVKENLVGSYQWKGRLNLLNIVMIGIANKVPAHDEKYELHRLLGTLLSVELTAAEKIDIMETEYRIPVDNKIREDVSAMCNLSQGILEKGEARGEAKGIAKGEAMGMAKGIAKGIAQIILTMHKNGYTEEQIAAAIDKDVEEVRAIIENREPTLV